MLEHYFVAAHPHVGGDVIALGCSHQRMQEQTIHSFEGALLNVFMGAVDGVAGLEAHHGFPSLFDEEFARIGRIDLVCGEQGVGVPLQQPNGTGEVDGSLIVNDGNARMLSFVRTIDVDGFVGFVIAIFLGQFQNADKPTGSVVETDPTSFFEGFGHLFFHGEGDGNRPRQTVGQSHIGDDGFVIGLLHESR